jgi:hypothetical protein
MMKKTLARQHFPSINFSNLQISPFQGYFTFQLIIFRWALPRAIPSRAVGAKFRLQMQPDFRDLARVTSSGCWCESPATHDLIGTA